MESKYIDLWNKTKSRLEEIFDENTYLENFDKVKDFYTFKNGNIFMICDSQFIKHKLDYFYEKRINEILKQFLEDGILMRFKFITKEEILTSEQNNISEPNVQGPELDRRYRVGNLNAAYTFKKFVIGQSNRVPYLSCLKVADQPGIVANPLYIFGDVGLGKTHLANAIGNHILDNDINKKILYIKTEDFIEDYGMASRKNNFESFKNKYKDIDVLLVDDIQFLAKKEKTQIEFFKLFENLFEENKQIVLTSDKPANELVNIMNRLTTRFAMGVTIDIKTPELELRKDIIRLKLSNEIPDPSIVPSEVITYIAESFQEDIRQLEGAIRRVIFYTTLENVDIDLDMAKTALKPIIKSAKTSVSGRGKFDIKFVLETVCDYYNISNKDITGKSRKREFVIPRHVVVYVLRELFETPYKEIGNLLGGRDHTTIMHSYTKAQQDLAFDLNLKKDIEKLLSKLGKK